MKLVKTRLLIPALFASLWLTGCASGLQKSIDDAETATQQISSKNANIEARLLERQKGPVTWPKKENLSQSTARRLINEDRDRLRTCVLVHSELAGEVKIRQIEESLKPPAQ